MDSPAKSLCKAYRFTMTAVSFGEDEDEAFLNLLESLGEEAHGVLEDGVSFEALDYVYMLRADMHAEG